MTKADGLVTTAVVLLLTAAYLVCAHQLVQGGELGIDHFSLLYEADPSRVIENSTSFFGDQARTRAHPLHVLLIAPLGTLLTWITNSNEWAAVLITTLCGALVLVNLDRVLDRALGLGLADRTLFVVLLGASASHVTFGGPIPETHVLSAFGLSCMARCLTRERLDALQRPGHTVLTWLKRGGAACVAASSFAVGMLVTNAAVLPVYFYHCVRPDSSSRKRRLMMALVTAGGVVALAAGLHLTQRAIWPPVRGEVPTSIPSFLVQKKDSEGTIPHWKEEESKSFLGKIDYVIHSLKSNTAWTTGADDLLTRVPHVANSVLVNALYAPRFLVIEHSWRVAPQVTFEPWNSNHRLVGGLGAVTWLGLLGTSLFLGRRSMRDLLSKPVVGFSAFVLVFQTVLFTLYGDEVFLFSPNWVFPLVLVAAALYAHCRPMLSASRATALRCALALATLCIVLNSFQLMRELFRVYT